MITLDPQSRIAALSGGQIVKFPVKREKCTVSHPIRYNKGGHRRSGFA